MVGSKGWINPKNKNVKYLNDITNFKNGDPSIILLPKSTEEIVKIMLVLDLEVYVHLVAVQPTLLR